jgi:hypothetical protein
MQGECKANAKRMQSECKANAKRMQSECKANAKRRESEMQRESKCSTYVVVEGVLAAGDGGVGAEDARLGRLVRDLNIVDKVLYYCLWCVQSVRKLMRNICKTNMIAKR